MKRALLVAALLSISCCGTGGGILNLLQGQAEPRVYVYLTDEDIWVDGRDAAAVCSYWLGESSRIWVEDMVPEWARPAVMAHELLHAAGMRGHPFPALDCYGTPHGCAGAYADGPCAEEVAWLRDCGGWRTVRVVDEELRDPTTWAVAMWNAATGREVFTIVK